MLRAELDYNAPQMRGLEQGPGVRGEYQLTTESNGNIMANGPFGNDNVLAGVLKITNLFLVNVYCRPATRAKQPGYDCSRFVRRGG